LTMKEEHCDFKERRGEKPAGDLFRVQRENENQEGRILGSFSGRGNPKTLFCLLHKK